MNVVLNRVGQLEFSDLYLGHHGLGDRICDASGACIDPSGYGDALARDLRLLEAACRQAWSVDKGRAGFVTQYDGVAYRALVVKTANGEIFVLRRLASEIASLKSLGIPLAYIRKLMQPDLSGLLIVTGPVKSGKTTTASALVRERLLLHGGVALTAEDPVELPLEGIHGNGVCFQSSVALESGGYPEAYRSMSRLSPKMIFLGELQGREVINQVLQATGNGHLVISTMQATNMTRAVERLYAQIQHGRDPLAARSLLVEGLLGIMHQQITGQQRKQIEAQFLFLRESAAAKANILRGDFAMIVGDTAQQMAAMIAENAAAERLHVA